MRLYCRPRILELTAAEELVALENMTVLQQNGFEVGLEGDQPAGRRLRLLAQPVSKNTEFDVQGKDSQFSPACQISLLPDIDLAWGAWVIGDADLEEILHLLRDRPSGTLVRSSKTRAMFAMRACRKSTMVGAPLNAKQMRTVSFFFVFLLLVPLHISHPFFFCFILTVELLDHSAHGNDGATVELSPRSADDETFVRRGDGGEEGRENC